MQTLPSGLHTPYEAWASTLLLGVTTSLLLAVGISEFSERGMHARSAAPAPLTGTARVFTTTENRAEWGTIAPATRPATAFGTTEASAEWTSVQPRIALD